MRRSIVPLVAVLAMAACTDSSPVGTGATSSSPRPSLAAAGEQVMPGEIIVKPRVGQEIAAIARDHGLALGAAGYRNAFFVLRGAVGNERALAARLGADARVQYAEPNYLRHTTSVDSRLWAFYNPGGLNMSYTRGGTGPLPSSYASTEDADEDAADVSSVGGSPVVIGSIDTGVDFTHPEFSTGRLIAGKDWYSNDNDPSDTDGHGTHTTGTMVGTNVGVAGVTGATNVRVYVQRVCGPRGCPTSAIASAIRAAADYGVVAMNLSLGGSIESQAEKDAITYATGKSALVIASAGNGGTGTVECPACDPNAISVAATNWQDEHTYYTNWGSGLDISAPGGECYSNTTPEGCIYSAYKGGGYEWLQGTSMAAPQVTGTAGVVASVKGYRGSQLRTQLLSTADDLGAAGYDTDFGNGRLNTYKAVMNGGGGPPPPATLSAAFTYSCNGLTCDFDGGSSTGSITSYTWTWGDGTANGSGVTPSHTFPNQVNTWTTTLQVTDGSASSSTSKQINCSKKGKNIRCR